MSKGTIILIVLVVIIVLAIGGWMLYVRQTGSPSSTNTMTNGTANANVPPPTPEPIKGDKAINKTLEYKSVPFEITTALQGATFGRVEAGTGKEFVVLFLKPTTAETANVFSWISGATKLQSGESSFTLKKVKMLTEGEEDKNAGYLWFEVDAGKTGWKLVMGEGEGAKSIDLGF